MEQKEAVEVFPGFKDTVKAPSGTFKSNMRRASTIVLSHLTPYRTSSSFLHKVSIANASTTIPIIEEQHSEPFSTLTKVKPCNKTQAVLTNSREHQFQTNPSRNLDTLVDKPPPQLSSRQRQRKERAQIEEAFESAATINEILKAFEDMESVFSEKDLGLACLKVGLKLDQEGEDPHKTLEFANRALKALDVGEKLSMLVGMALQLMGSACYSLNKFNDSLGYLNRANRILGQLEEEGICSIDDIRPVLHAVQLQLANTKTAMGRREDALINLRKCLDIKELTLDKDSVELGTANRDLAEAYIAVLNFKEALPLCLKALEIHKAQLGNNSVEVAKDRRILGIIYCGLEEHEKALEQNDLSQKVLKNWGLSADLLRAEIDAANMQIALGKYEEAINTLKSVVNQTDKESENRALVFISMGKALSNQKKFADSKRCLEIACGILDKKEIISQLEVSEAYIEISMQYETMNEFETAISLLKRALTMLEKQPQEQHSEGSVSARIGYILLLTGKVQEAIPYLESAAERLKECFGSKHYGVAYIYNNLGAAYMELDRPQSAAQMFAFAKDIMDVSLGPHHADTIDSCQNLSKAYGAMGNYKLAIEFQEQAIETWESHGSSAQDELKEAHRILEELKQKACKSFSNELLTETMPLPHNVTSFQASQKQPNTI